LIVAHNFGVVSSEGIRIPVPRWAPHRNHSAPGGQLASLGLTRAAAARANPSLTIGSTTCAPRAPHRRCNVRHSAHPSPRGCTSVPPDPTAPPWVAAKWLARRRPPIHLSQTQPCVPAACRPAAGADV